MLAILKTGGKQFTVKPGDTLKVEKIEGEVGSSVTLKDVLMVSKDGDVTVGNPTVSGAQVDVEILQQSKGKKVIIFKRRRRQDYKKRQGHRQLITTIKVKEIKFN